MNAIDAIVMLLLGATAMYTYMSYLEKKMGLLPQFTVQKINGEWHVNNLVKGLSVEDRDKVITILLEEVDKLDAGTQYNLDS